MLAARIAPSPPALIEVVHHLHRSNPTAAAAVRARAHSPSAIDPASQPFKCGQKPQGSL